MSDTLKILIMPPPSPEVISFLGLVADEAQGFGKPWTGPMVPVSPGRRVVWMSERAQSEQAMCHGKARYSCKKDAVTVAAGAMSRRKNRPKQLRAYACPHCSGWHLTSKPLRSNP
jgi:hypothetical protein